MRRLAMMAVLASTALAAPAMARDKAWYVGIEGGGMLVQDAKINIGQFTPAGAVVHKPGFYVNGIAGYELRLDNRSLGNRETFRELVIANDNVARLNIWHSHLREAA